MLHVDRGDIIYIWSIFAIQTNEGTKQKLSESNALRRERVRVRQQGNHVVSCYICITRHDETAEDRK